MMRSGLLKYFGVTLFILLLTGPVLLHAGIPFLRSQGTAVQLIVDGKPFLIIGGELGNSTASSRESMAAVWPKLNQLHVNTVLAPVYWEFIEPEQGRFDFTSVNWLIADARTQGIRLVLLWFGSWKNSMSCYAPYWIKSNPAKFPRAVDKNGRTMEMLSCFDQNNLDADRNAFTALMRHLSQIDSKQNTVIMVQVENEIGMIPDARDYSRTGDARYAENVPGALIEYLTAHKQTLAPELTERWARNGFQTTGSWEDLFSEGPETEEIFMAWHYALYVNAVAESGRKAYNLPMYVNAALIREGYLPGQYPSAGPLPHLIDIWRAGAPVIDFIAPDIYFPNFEEWCQKYNRSGNPLFIPEAGRGNSAAINLYYALGQHDAMGYSPFSIESTDDPSKDPLGQSYRIVSQLTPLILESQGKGMMAAATVDETNQDKRILLGDYIFVCSHEYTNRWTVHAPEESWPKKGCLIIQTGPDDYYIAGSGVIVTFEPAEKDAFTAGIGSLDEGTFDNGIWHAGRRMNGDQSHQGRHLRLSHWEHSIQKVKLYRY